LQSFKIGIINGELLDDDFHWVVGQVERVEKLEESLKFYTDENNYEPKMNWWQQEDYELSEVIQDSGNIAKSALEETK
jgi:hypothetical protein